MMTRVCTSLARAVRAFHEDERGDVMQSVSVGAIGVLLCGVVFYVLKNALAGDGMSSGNNVSSMLGSFISGIGTGVTGWIGKVL